MTAPLDTDLAVVGSGFGGSLLAMVARRLGCRVALLERGTHPRFAIGESASPLAGVIIEQLAARYDLPRLAPLAAYGAWRRHYPDVTCGLKRGFTYFKHADGSRFTRRVDRSHELLVAASPSDDVSDTHWLRSDVDHFLMQEAVACGADYIDQIELSGVEWRGDAAVLTGHRRGSTVRVRARFVVDATGPRGFLSRLLNLDAPGFAGYPPTQALYSHFIGVARCADLPEFASDEVPPYPIDAAALHHVFDQGWMWVLRFDNGVTSAGVAVTDTLAADLRLADGEPAWRRLLQRYPTVAAQFSEAHPIREFTWMPRLSWRTAGAGGDRWAMLPSAAAFIDPLFSTGMPLTLLGVERLARRIAEGEAWSGLDVKHVQSRRAAGEAAPPSQAVPARASRGAAAYGEITLNEADHVAQFIAGCYAAFPCFEQFADWSMFYFAAASFSEMSRRLHGDAWSRGFLLANDPRFVRAMAEWRAGRYDHGAADAISHVNAAGLANAAKRNWYAVDVEDAVRAADLLNAEPDRVRSLFAVGA